eukprot:1145766-Pelagomonas_calceolata.AAC.4
MTEGVPPHKSSLHSKHIAYNKQVEGIAQIRQHLFCNTCLAVSVAMPTSEGNTQDAVAAVSA